MSNPWLVWWHNQMLDAAASCLRAWLKVLETERLVYQPYVPPNWCGFVRPVEKEPEKATYQCF